MPRYGPRWPITTERLELRPFRAEDLVALHAVRSKPEVVRYLYDEPLSFAEAEALLEGKIAASSLAAEGDWLSAAVVLRGSGELVGDVSLRWASREHRGGEIGFVFDPAHHGHGYATEAAWALLGFGFDDLRLHRIVGRLDARNTASARLLERLGMRREAHLVENEWVKGEWQSELVYALLDREWRLLA